MLPRRRVSLCVVLPCVLGVVLPLGAAGQDAPPAVSARFQALVDALKASGEPTTITEAAGEPLAPELNASTFYRRAFAGYVAPDQMVGRLRGTGQWSPEALDRVRAWLETNRQTVVRVRQASLVQECQYDGPFEWWHHPTLGPGMELVLAVKCSMQVHLEEGQPDLAFADCLTGLRVARHFGLRVELVDMHRLAGWALQPLPHLLDEESIGDREREEAAAVLKDFLESLSPARHVRFLRARCIEEYTHHRGLNLSESEAIAAFEALNELASLADKPYHEVAARWRETENRLFHSPQTILWAMSVTAKFLRSETPLSATLCLGLVALELEACRRTTGSYPKTLGDMKLAYLSELPDDPCSGQPLRYTRTPDGFVLYSVGANARDEGGASSDSEQDDIIWRVGGADNW